MSISMSRKGDERVKSQQVSPVVTPRARKTVVNTHISKPQSMKIGHRILSFVSLNSRCCLFFQARTTPVMKKSVSSMMKHTKTTAT